MRAIFSIPAAHLQLKALPCQCQQYNMAFKARSGAAPVYRSGKRRHGNVLSRNLRLWLMFDMVARFK